MAREHTRVFLEVIDGRGVRRAEPAADVPQPARPAAASSRTRPGLRDRIWWGAGTRATAEWTAEQGMNLMSSTLLTEDTGVPFHQLQAEQIQRVPRRLEGGRPRARAAGLGQPQHLPDRQRAPTARTSARESRSQDQVGFIDGGTARFGKTYAGEPDQLVKELAEDEAIAAADTLLLTVPNQLGVDYNAHVLDSVRSARRAGARLALTAGPGALHVEPRLSVGPQALSQPGRQPSSRAQHALVTPTEVSPDDRGGVRRGGDCDRRPGL